MRIVEIRDLDGPNLFLKSPAIKTELGDVAESDAVAVISTFESYIRDLHEAVGIDAPEHSSRIMEEPGDIVVAFAWQKRAFAMSLAKRAAQLTIGERDDYDAIVSELRSVLAREPEDDDAPLLIRAADRSIPIIAITGTNGKTTTTRLISSVLKFSGKTVGLTSSAGVFIDTKQVLEGDYSGPSGARRVFEDSSVDVAVLETARGGMLLRGCAYEDADVAIVTNVTADHMGLHGVYSLEGLAEVKAIVARNVSADGYCILNADDKWTSEMGKVTPGTPVFFSRQPDSELMGEHIAAGGSGVQLDAEGNVVWHQAGEHTTVTNVADIPMTFSGKAPHQVENALGAIAALICLDVPIDVIRDGMQRFRSTAESSKGRLNVYDIDGATVIIDFAHNEVGLTNLLNFGREMVEGEGQLIAIVGTAGDRDDAALRAIGKRAAELADIVVLKDSSHYLRGRQPGEMPQVMRMGVQEAGEQNIDVREAVDERAATMEMLGVLQPNDVLAVMCIEDFDFLHQEILSRGTPRV